MAGTAVLIPEIIGEALTALNAILGVIQGIHAQGGLTADQILASAQAMQQANDTLYTTLIAALKTAPPVAPAVASAAHVEIAPPEPIKVA